MKRFFNSSRIGGDYRKMQPIQKNLAYNAFLFGVHLETDLTEEELKQI